MQWKRTIAAAGLVITLSTGPVANAERLFWSRARACNQSSIRGYRYSEDQLANSVSIDLINSVGQPELATLEGPDDSRTTVRRKSYYPTRRTTTVDGLSVTGMVVQLRDNGMLTSSCHLAFNGHEEAALRGTNVTLRLRAYTGANTDDREQLTMIWESVQSTWVSTGRPKSIPIVPVSQDDRVHSRNTVYPIGAIGHDRETPLQIRDLRSRPDAVLREHFDAIDLFEFVIEKQTDR